MVNSFAVTFQSEFGDLVISVPYPAADGEPNSYTLHQAARMPHDISFYDRILENLGGNAHIDLIVKCSK